MIVTITFKFYPSVTSLAKITTIIYDLLGMLGCKEISIDSK